MDAPLHILHLEDDAMDSALVGGLLQEDGLATEIDRVATMAEFHAALDCSRHDLILSDFTIPGMDVHEAFLVARQRCPQVPFIFVSGTLGEELAIEMLKQGADDYVLKQRIERLVPSVRRALKEAEEQSRRQQAEEALRKSEQRLRATFDKAAVGIIEVEGDDHHCVAVNDRVCEILGYRREELLGRTVHDLTFPEDRPQSDDLNAQLHEGVRDTISYEKRYLRRDGVPLWVHVAVSAVRDAQGHVLRSIGTVEDISERKRAEEEIRSIAEFPAENPSPVMRVSSDGAVLYTNRPAVDLLEPMGWCAGQRLPEKFLEPVQHLVAVGQKEFDLECSQGRVYSFVLAPSKRDGQFNLYGRDVTDRRRSEAALRQSEQRFRATFEQAAVGMGRASFSDARWMDVNDMFCQMLGYTREQMLATPWPEITHPEDVELDMVPFRRMAAGELDSYSVEKRFIHQRGHPVWARLTLSLVRNAHGQPDYEIAIIENIHARKQAEEALREQQRLYQTVTDNAALALLIMNSRQHCEFMNPAAVQLTGFTLDEVRGQPLHDVIHHKRPDGSHYPLSECPIDQAFPKNDRERGEEVFVHKDGHFYPVAFTASPIRDVTGTPVGTIIEVEDITERKRAEEELKAAKESAERAKASAEQANRAKDHFLAVLSHELRTPLTPVVMGVSMIQERADLAPEVRETLEMVRRNVEMEARLIDDLLDLTRITRGKVELQRQRVELCRVIDRAVEVCRPDIESRDLEFGVDIGPDAPYWVDVDAARLQQVFWNLLKNAVKFTPKDGCVGIRCRLDQQGHVVAEVNDSGIGIEAEALGRVFNAFEQAERSITRQFGGLGLGLAISKALVEMHGGQIEAHSEGRGKGTSFRVRLPLAAPAAHSPTPVAVEDPKRVGRPLRILLVEDHGVTARIMQRVLAAEGHEVQTAGDVATGLAVANQHRFDLLLSDLGLPDGSGHDLIVGLRAQGHRFPGIALSGYGQEEDIKRSYAAGFSAHLTKPASRESLLAAIAQVTSARSTEGMWRA